MKRYKTFSISGSDNENLTDLLAGLGERDRKIIGFYFSSSLSNAGINDNHRLRVYREQDQLVDHQLIHYSDLNNTSATTALSVDRYIEVNLDIKRGEGLQGGFYNSSSAPSGVITMVYEDKINN